jgi:aryl-alcohol dehydrogenase-like predicted oxidoreductase
MVMHNEKGAGQREPGPLDPKRRGIGRTGITVQAIGLGGMPLSLPALRLRGERLPQAEASAVIRAFLEAGGDFIDTANVYCLDDADMGHNERLIAAALRECQRPDVKVATKGGLTRPAGRWETDGRPAWIRAAAEASLAALGVAQIFLYQLHAVDPRVPLVESVGEMRRLQEEGKVAHLGLSNVSVAQVREAQTIARIESVQNRFNLFERRDLQNGLIPFCAEHGITYLAYSPVGGHFGHAEAMAHGGLKARAAALGVTPYALALAWILSLGPALLPIPGASRIESVADSRKALDLSLSLADSLRQAQGERAPFDSTLAFLEGLAP